MMNNGLWKIVAGMETKLTATVEKPKFLQNQQIAQAHIALHVSLAWLSVVCLQSDPKDISEVTCFGCGVKGH